MYIIAYPMLLILYTAVLFILILVPLVPDHFFAESIQFSTYIMYNIILFS